MQASLSVALFMSAYILQQRYNPYLVSTTLSANLALNMERLEQRLHDAALRRASNRVLGTDVHPVSITRRRSRMSGQDLQV
jgi:hypothetical protein